MKQILNCRLFSTSVLLFLRNVNKRYKTFVANRIAEILSCTTISQWRFVPTSMNPADITSRGATVNELQKSIWFSGPDFLWLKEDQWPECPGSINFGNDPTSDIEIKKHSMIAATIVRNETIDRFIEFFSDWKRLIRCTAWLVKFKQWLLMRSSQSANNIDDHSKLTIDDLKIAENSILQIFQKQQNWKLDRCNSLVKLDHVVIDDLICVGGRLSNSDISDEAKHQIIIPKDHHVTTLIIRKIHEENGHVGVNHVLTLVRERFWPIQGRSTVKRVICGCRTCRRWKSRSCSQKMADLPVSRVTFSPRPFDDCGVDLFGPLHVKYRRGTVKRYGCIFTCFRTRAIHLEMAFALDTDSFISSFERFSNRRGLPSRMYSDNGTNFVGAFKEVGEKRNYLEFQSSRIATHRRRLGKINS